ncbi:hypothetical protein MNV49_004376 [Pseudohyphozyma bogoriensis]|nr:hypothetical protein MNV49_004376 [Pseudohyphozyma bogoriensis]
MAGPPAAEAFSEPTDSRVTSKNGGTSEYTENPSQRFVGLFERASGRWEDPDSAAEVGVPELAGISRTAQPVDPPINIRIEQWVRVNGVPALDAAPNLAPLIWHEGGPPVAASLHLPIISFFHTKQLPPLNLLPFPSNLQPQAQFTESLINVPAARLQSIFTEIARVHHLP